MMNVWLGGARSSRHLPAPKCDIGLAQATADAGDIERGEVNEGAEKACGGGHTCAVKVLEQCQVHVHVDLADRRLDCWIASPTCFGCLQTGICTLALHDVPPMHSLCVQRCEYTLSWHQRSGGLMVLPYSYCMFNDALSILNQSTQSIKVNVEYLSAFVRRAPPLALRLLRCLSFLLNDPLPLRQKLHERQRTCVPRQSSTHQHVPCF